MEIYQSLLVYLVYTLLPLVPAIVIYKLFPETSVGTSGVLGNLKINATGAFAAYIITVILGNWVVDSTDYFIKNQDKSKSWEVSADIEFVDAENIEIHNITQEDVNRKFKITTRPDYEITNKSSFVYMAYGEKGPPTLIISYPGFKEKKIILSKVETNKEEERKIDLGKITLKKNDKPYEASTNNSIVPRISGGPTTLQKNDETSN